MQKFYLTIFLSFSLSLKSYGVEQQKPLTKNFQSDVRKLYIAFMSGASPRLITGMIQKNSLQRLNELKNHFKKEAKRQSAEEKRIFRDLVESINSEKVKKLQDSNAQRGVIDQILKVLKIFIKKKEKAQNRLTLYNPRLHRSR